MHSGRGGRAHVLSPRLPRRQRDDDRLLPGIHHCHRARVDVKRPAVAPLNDEGRRVIGKIQLHRGDDTGQPAVLRADLETVATREPVAPNGVRGRKPPLTGTGPRGVTST